MEQSWLPRRELLFFCLRRFLFYASFRHYRISDMYGCTGMPKTVRSRRYRDVTLAPFNPGTAVKTDVSGNNSVTELVRLSISEPSNSTGCSQWAKIIPG